LGRRVEGDPVKSETVFVIVLYMIELTTDSARGTGVYTWKSRREKR
jgi:hypothetical protein